MLSATVLLVLYFLVIFPSLPSNILPFVFSLDYDLIYAVFFH